MVVLQKNSRVIVRGRTRAAQFSGSRLRGDPLCGFIVRKFHGDPPWADSQSLAHKQGESPRRSSPLALWGRMHAHTTTHTHTQTHTHTDTLPSRLVTPPHTHTHIHLSTCSQITQIYNHI